MYIPLDQLSRIADELADARDKIKALEAENRHLREQCVADSEAMQSMKERILRMGG